MNVNTKEEFNHMTDKIPKKKAFNFYRSYYDILNMLNDKQYVEFSKAINSVMFFDAHIDSISFKDKTLSMLWVSVSHSIRQSVDGFLSKNNLQYNQAINPPAEGAYQGAYVDPCQQEEEKGEEQGKGKGEVEQAMLPRFIDPDIWDHFLSHRASLKAKMSERAQTLLVNKLVKLNSEGHDVNDLLDNAIMNGWKSVYPEKGNKDNLSDEQRFSQSGAGQWMKEMESKHGTV
jgi:hypothetical protein